ncbi:hypothetical protein DNTS_030180 [Danionella cerebrum]|uniref:Uncharacterized protein n=1 Tax=Danionella cerebrum TaxID=2873325 RepID=A0A553Q837_9TELE|nr:hypothetical protein DNTS_030180 [Danionella translucida]
MAKRKAKTTAPKKTQSRTKQQRSTGDTNLCSAEVNQDSERSHNGLDTSNMDGHRRQEEKTSSVETEKHVMGTNSCEVAETLLTTVQTSKTDKHLTEDQSEEMLKDEESKLENISKEGSRQSRSPDSEQNISQCDATCVEPKNHELLGSSEIVAENTLDQMEMAECDAKKNKRKRMGMCRLGERKMLRVHAIERQGNEVEQFTNQPLGKYNPISLEEEASTVPSFPTSCPFEDKPGGEEQHQANIQDVNDQEAQKLVESMPIVAEIDCTKNCDGTCTREDENASDATSETLCQMDTGAVVEATDVLLNDPLDDIKQEDLLDAHLKESIEASASTPEDPIQCELLPAARDDKIHFESEIKCLKKEQSVELMEITANQPMRLDHDLVGIAEPCEKKPCCEENCIQVHPCGEDHVQQNNFKETESSGELGTVADLDPRSPILESLSIPEAPCELEDATELVCSLIRDLSSLNYLVKDVHRRIGFVTQRKINPRPQHSRIYRPPFSDQ